MKRQDSLRSEDGSVVDQEAVYRAHKARIVGLCRLMLADPDEAEDVAQEVFLRASQYLGAHEAPAVWEAWLVRVAVNACHDRRRSWWWKNRWKRVNLDEASAGFVPSSPSSEAEALARERRARIWRQVHQLKHQQREVFVLRYVEGWSTAEVAKAMGLSTASVKTHLFRAVRRLRKALEP